MGITRRPFLLTPCLALTAKMSGQGVASRIVKAQPKSLPSGRPFDARFTDIAPEAGLNTPVIYGDPANTDYILETAGCGCAFIDFDNDGWIDIFNFKQNTPQGGSSPQRRRSSLQEQPRRNLHRCDCEIWIA